MAEQREFTIGEKVVVSNADGSEWVATIKFVPPAGSGKKHDPTLVDVMADGTGSVTSVARDRLRRVTPPQTGLDRSTVDHALRQVIAHADYDLHKSIERDEETGQDNYGEYVDRFITEYSKADAK